MDRQTLRKRWQVLSEEAISGMADWRIQHPKATLKEIEAASLSHARDWGEQPGEIPTCPSCGTPLKRGGLSARRLQTQGSQVVELKRRYGVCPRCGSGVFPLDKELDLFPGHLTPHAHECLVRLGTWMPFEKAATELTSSLKACVSEATARRYTQAAGAAQVEWQTREAERLAREAAPAPAGPSKLYMSADGAFVPLVGGEWAEVKTLVIGEVSESGSSAGQGEPAVHTRQLSYFSRLADAQTFTRLALVETHLRGVENAGQVGAVVDGAEWLQGFVNWHRPDAVRILDFAHASGYVSKVDQAAFGADTPELAAWLKGQLHTLKHHGPDDVLRQLRERVAQHPQAEAMELPHDRWAEAWPHIGATLQRQSRARAQVRREARQAVPDNTPNEHSATGEPSARRQSARTQSERTQSERTQSERTQSERTQSERTQSERTQSNPHSDFKRACAVCLEPRRRAYPDA